MEGNNADKNTGLEAVRQNSFRHSQGEMNFAQQKKQEAKKEATCCCTKR